MNDADLRAHEDLAAYLDGALDDPAAIDAVLKRLRTDPAYARRASELRALDDLLDLHGAVAAPASIADRVVELARAEASREASRRGLFRAAAAAAVLLAVGGAYFGGAFGGAPEGGDAPIGVGPVAVADLEPYANLAPAEEGPDELAEVEARLALLERVQNDFFSG
jgi:anti-sigma factor RsiW